MLATIRSKGRLAAKGGWWKPVAVTVLTKREAPLRRTLAAATLVATGSMSVASTGIRASLAMAIASTALPVPRSSALRGRSRRTTRPIISRQPAVVP